VAGALDLLRRGACRHAARLWVVPEGKWQKIVRVEFDDEIPDELDIIPSHGMQCWPINSPLYASHHASRISC